MKKILSISLSAILIVTCLLSIPFITNAKVNIEWHSSTSFDSVEYYNTHGNNNFWIELDKEVSVNDDAIIRYKYNNDATKGQNAVSHGAIATNPIISAVNTKENTTKNTDVKNFKWSFSYAAPSADKATTYTYFMFHVDKNRASTPSVYTSDMFNYTGGADSAGLDDMSGFFAVVFKGAGETSSDGLMSGAYTVIQPTKLSDGSWAMRPIEYTEKDGVITPTENAYMKYATDAYAGSIDVTIELRDNVLYLKSFYQGKSWVDDKEKSFTLSNEALAAAPSGDFVYACSDISVNQGETGFDRAKHLHSFSSVVIDELTYSTNEEFAETGLIFDSAEQTDWLASKNGFNISYNSNIDAYNLSNGSTSVEVLSHNGVPVSFVNQIDDFVCEFDLYISHATWMNAALLFHVNDTTVFGENTTEKGKQNSSVRNALGVMFTGNSHTNNAGMITFANASSAVGLGASDTYNSTYCSGTPIKGEAGFTGGATYKVRLAYNNGAATLVIYNVADKENTYTTAYYEYTEEQIGSAKSGGFVFLTNDATVAFGNMKVWSGSTACDYVIDPAYNDYKTAYTFDNSVHDLKINAVDGCTIECDEVNSALKINSNQIRTQIEGFDGGNNNLGDFILKYDWTETHHWSKEIIDFRKLDHYNHYSLKNEENGAQNGTNLLYNTIKLTKNVGGVETLLAEVRVSKKFFSGNKHTTMIKAIGNTIEVYFGPMGTVSTTPIISVEDDSFTAGNIRHCHNGSIGYIYDMDIYDLTAKAYNEAAAVVGIATDRSGYVDAMAYYAENPINDVQLAKTSALSAIILEHKAVNINGDETVGDVLDLVVLSNKSGTSVAEAFDPVVDGIYDANDGDYIRKNFILK